MFEKDKRKYIEKKNKYFNRNCYTLRSLCLIKWLNIINRILYRAQFYF